MKKIQIIFFILLLSFIWQQTIIAQNNLPTSTEKSVNQESRTNTATFTYECLFDDGQKYYIQANDEIVQVAEKAMTTVGQKINKSFWQNGGFIIKIHEIEYAVDGNGMIWARSGQFVETVGTAKRQ